MTTPHAQNTPSLAHEIVMIRPDGHIVASMMGDGVIRAESVRVEGYDAVAHDHDANGGPDE